MNTYKFCDTLQVLTILETVGFGMEFLLSGILG